MTIVSPITTAGALVFVALIAALFCYEWRRRRLESQWLASALIGEIAAVLATIEVQRVVDTLQDSESDPRGVPYPHGFALPRLMVYEACAGKLDHLGAPVQRMVTQLFDRLAALPIEIASLEEARYTLPLENGGPSSRVLGSVKEVLELADETLVALRSIATPHSRARQEL